MHPRQRSQSGFTLLELLVVVVILGLLAGMAAMTSPAEGSQRVELAEVYIRDALARAQALASANRSPHGVVFDVANERMVIVDENGTPATDPLTKGDYIIDFTRPNMPRVDLRVANFGAAGVAAMFDAQGVPLTAGTIVIGHQSQSLTLALDAATGFLSASSSP